MKSIGGISRLINYLTAGYVLLFVFVPPMQVGTIYRLIAIGATVLWFFTRSNLGKRHISKNELIFLMVSVFCISLMISLLSFQVGFANAVKGNLQFIIICIVAYMSLYYFENDPAFFDKWMTLALAVIAFFCVTTIIALFEDPYASRIANSEWLEDRFEGNENVGLYGYVYMCIMLFPLLLYKVISGIKVNRLFDLLTIVDLVLIGVMTLNAGYMIGLCCWLVGTFIVLFMRKISLAKVILLLILIVVFFLAYEPIVSAFFDFAMDLLGDNIVYRQKINDFRLLFLEGTSTGSSVDGRFSNYGASIAEVLRYPVFGSYLFGKSIGGGHSTFFDTIGKMGWLVAVLYFYIMWRFPYKIYTSKTRKTDAIKLAIIVMFVIYGVFDPYSQEIGLTSMVFLPYFLYITNRDEQKKALQESKTV